MGAKILKIFSQGLVNLSDSFIHHGYVSAAGGADGAEATATQAPNLLLSTGFLIVAFTILVIVFIYWWKRRSTE